MRFIKCFYLGCPIRLQLFETHYEFQVIVVDVSLEDFILSLDWRWFRDGLLLLLINFWRWLKRWSIIISHLFVFILLMKFIEEIIFELVHLDLSFSLHFEAFEWVTRRDLEKIIIRRSIKLRLISHINIQLCIREEFPDHFFLVGLNPKMPH